MHRVHQNLLTEFRKIPGFEKRKKICWKQVKVIGWPQDILFYNSYHSSQPECKKILAALERGEIRFELKEPSKKKHVTLAFKKALQAKAFEISKELFGDRNEINWKAIKEHFPDLHLKSFNFRKIDAEDCEALESALKSLKEKFGLTGISFDDLHCDDVESIEESIEASQAAELEVEVASIASLPEVLLSLRALVQAQLLEKYRERIMNAQIYWLKVDVLGWPNEVIFYSSECWSEIDCKILLESMPNINFVNLLNPHRSLSAEAVNLLEQKLKEFFLRHFGTKEYNWSLVTSKMPDFHLTHYNFSKWNSKDVSMFAALIKLFETKRSAEEVNLENQDYQLKHKKVKLSES